MNFKNEVIKQSPGILSGLGVIGFISSVVMVAKVAPKAEKIIEEASYTPTPHFCIDNQLGFLDKVKLVAPIYAPTAGMILISTACIIASNHTYRHRYASLLALYSISEVAVGKWQAAALEEVGPRKFDKVKERVLGSEEDPPEILLVDEKKSLFYDGYLGRWFTTDSVETVRRIVNDLNEQLLKDDFVPLNDLYYALGCDHVPFGDDVGWNLSIAKVEVQFNSFIRKDRPYISIMYSVEPRDF